MALAVDWVTSNLYWSSTKKSDLHVTSRRDGYTTLLLQGALKVTEARLPVTSLRFVVHVPVLSLQKAEV